MQEEISSSIFFAGKLMKKILKKEGKSLDNFKHRRRW